MYVVQCWNAIRDTRQSWPTLPSWKTVLLMISNNLLHEFIDIKALYHFATDFGCVLLQLVDIVITLFKHWMSYRQPIWHSSLKHLNCWWKAVQNVICYSWIFNGQLYVHLKNWTLTFKLLHLLNVWDVSIKCAWYNVWILTNKFWKFG